MSRSTARIQQALIDLGHDLGPTGADMVYGAKTAAAVRDFKAKENLGFTQFGDVGPGTMSPAGRAVPRRDSGVPHPRPDDGDGGGVGRRVGTDR